MILKNLDYIYKLYSLFMAYRVYKFLYQRIAKLYEKKRENFF